MQEIERQSFKFRNGLQHYALQPDERLLGYVFQPRIVQRYLRVIRRDAAPTTLLALTDTELIVVEEGLGYATRYGWFFTFCPRMGVAGIEIESKAGRQAVRARLARGKVTAERQVTLENDAALAWRDLWMRHGPSLNRDERRTRK